MSVSLAPSPPPTHVHDNSRLTSSASMPVWPVHTRAPSGPIHGAGPGIGRYSPSFTGPQTVLPFVTSAPSATHAGQGPPGFVPLQQRSYVGINLPPPVSQPSTAMAYSSGMNYSAPTYARGSFHAPGVHHLPLFDSRYAGAPQHASQTNFTPYSGVTASSMPSVSAPVHANASGSGPYHPYRASHQATSHSQMPITRPPEQSMFSPPIGPGDLARLRQNSAGSASSSRQPRDPQPFPGRIRTQSYNADQSSAHRSEYRGETRSGVSAPPRTLTSSPGSGAPNPSANTSVHCPTPSTASAAAAIAGPPEHVSGPADRRKSSNNRIASGLRRAFSMQTLNSSTTSTTDSVTPKTPELSRDSTSSSGTSGASTSPPSTPPARQLAQSGPPRSMSSRMGRLGMSRANRSTDNLSISSTVSSASMMIRKLGQIGKRSSLSGISAIFGKEREKAEDDTLRADSEMDIAVPAARKRKDRKKGVTVDPTVSHATAELDRTSTPTDKDGLTPAEAMVKRHQQLMSQQQDVPGDAGDSLGNTSEIPKRWVPTSGRSASPAPVATAAPRLPTLQTAPINLAFVEDPSSGFSFAASDEMPTPTDDTPRQSVEYTNGISGSRFDDDTASLYDGGSEYEGSLYNGHSFAPPRRAESLGPVKGILRNAESYNQEDLIKPRALPSSINPFNARIRANSYDVPSSQALPTHHQDVLVSADVVDGVATHPQRATSPIYSHPSYNVSAPLLRRDQSALHVAQRAASSPQVRRCTFAPSSTVHMTWPAALYDRRGEPATCNRLTPALAQRIKEELNDYKMTEMHVHAHSRIFTHFLSTE